VRRDNFGRYLEIVVGCHLFRLATVAGCALLNPSKAILT